MTNTCFDDRRINWQTLAGFEHLAYRILNIDEQLNIIDVFFKFAAKQQIVLHRHLALNNTLVIQGEHCLYTPDGRLKEVRSVGTYIVSPASDEPHREGGGGVDAIVLFSIRGSNRVLYEILDDNLSVIATLSMQDFVGLFKVQQGTAE